jgi:hypothetical protein
MNDFFFVSYAHKDERFVVRLIDELEKQGFAIWIDRKDILAGKNWPAEIVNAITDCLGFIVAISKNSVISDGVVGELASARKHKKNIIPIILDDSTIPPRFEYLLGDIQYVDFYRDGFNTGLIKIIGALRTFQAVLPKKLETRPSKKVFICYKRNVDRDQKLVSYLSEKLQNNDYSVFLDLTMRTGENWLERIDVEINQSDFLVVLISKDSANSEMVQAEVRRAFEYRKKQGHPQILPIRIAYEELLPYSIDAFINPFQYIIWNDERDNEKVCFELLSAIRGDLPDKVIVTPKTGKVVTLSVDGIPTLDESELHPPLPEFDPRTLNELEYVGGTVKLSDKFYVERDEDNRLKIEIKPKTRKIIAIKAPRQTGKSSLLVRGLQYAREQGKTVVHISAEVIDKQHLEDLDRFLRFIAEFVLRRLHIDTKLIDKYWEGGLSPSVKLTSLFEDCILPEVDSLVIAMDEIDTLLKVNFYEEFFSLIRLWYNKGADTPEWDKLNTVLVVGTEPYLLIPDIHRSPFNIGVNLNLNDFSKAQVADITHRHGSPMSSEELIHFNELLNGHPYLTRRALYSMAKESVSWGKLVKTATSDQGIFGDHLKNYMFYLRHDAKLRDAIKSIVKGQKSVDEDVLYRLERAGIIRRDDNNYLFRCKLYQDYFREKFNG